MKYLSYPLLFFSLNSFAQTADWIFTPPVEPHNFDSSNETRFSNIITDTSTKNNYLLASIKDTVIFGGVQYITKNNSYDLLLLKLNEGSNIIWAKQIGGPEDDFPSSLDFHNGELLLSMWYFNSTEVNNQQYFQEEGRVLLLKLNKSDASYNSIQQFNINGSISSLSISKNNEIYITGLFSINSSIGQFDLPDPYIRDIWRNKRASDYIYLAKLDQNLSTLWVSHSAHGYCCGSPNVGVVKTNPYNDDVIIMGRSSGPVVFEGNYMTGAGSVFSFLVCYDKDGNLKWTQKGQAVTDETFSDVYFSDFDITDRGEIYLVGNYDDEAQLGSFILPDENGDGYINGFVSKLNDSGQFVWAKSILGGRGTGVSSIICKDNNCYFGGSFRDYLKFDGIEIVDSISSLTTTGYIGKVENEDYMNKLLFLKTTGYSSLSKLSYNKSGFINVLGDFHTDISIGCLSATIDYMSPFASRLDIDDEIDQPIISGNSEVVCDNNPYFFNIDNYDPNYDYTLVYPEGVSVTNQSGSMIELGVLDSAPDTVNLNTIASNKCNWKAVSNRISFINKSSPELNGEILTPDKFCEGSENQILSTAAGDNILFYNWSLPEGFSVDGMQEVSTGSNIIEVEINKSFKEGIIKLTGSNECGVTDALTKEITAFSKLPTPALTGDQLICNNNNAYTYQANFNAELVGSITYYWQVSGDLLLPNDGRQDSSKTSQISVEVNDVFRQRNQYIKVKATNECYTSEITTLNITGSELPEIPEVIIGECDRSIKVNLQKDFEWYFNGHKTNFSSSSINDIDSGFYQVKSSNVCGEEWSTPIYVDPVILEHLFIPNIITPNGDGFNERFVIDQSLKHAFLAIYNRWGIEVYKNHSYSNEWSASNLSSGVYYYLLNHNCLNQSIRGTITVLK